MSRRLRASTNWDPGRTIALAALGTPLTVALAGANTLEGLRGATPNGGLWFAHDGRLTQHTPTQEKAPMNSLLPRPPVEIAPGAVHIPDWLTLEQQRDLVTACRGWAAGPAPMRQTQLPNRSTMSVQTVCLGWHWTPYRYTRVAVDQNDAPVTPFPEWLGELSRQALTDAYGAAPISDRYEPDAALINFYDRHAKLGMHQDKDEHSDAPVVSLSVGATCIFRFGNTKNRNAPYTDIELRSGDLFIFGGPSRLAYHGVPHTIQAGTTNPDTGRTNGRLNITVRDTGLSPVDT
jgi:alkylated DNA repair protein (DNA oxidative demethylase)